MSNREDMPITAQLLVAITLSVPLVLAYGGAWLMVAISLKGTRYESVLPLEALLYSGCVIMVAYAFYEVRKEISLPRQSNIGEYIE